MHYSPTQQAIITLLADGKSHHRCAIRDCVGDCYTSWAAVAMHLMALRKKLRPMGQDIICELRNATIYYRQVRMLHTANDGRR